MSVSFKYRSVIVSSGKYEPDSVRSLIDSRTLEAAPAALLNMPFSFLVLLIILSQSSLFSHSHSVERCVNLSTVPRASISLKSCLTSVSVPAPLSTADFISFSNIGLYTSVAVSALPYAIIFSVGIVSCKSAKAIST